MGLSFEDISGHQREIGILRAAILNQRVAHAYIFAGQEGTGKMLAARAFARALNCEAPLDGDSCGRCDSCGRMDAGTHLNLIMAAPTDGYLKIGRIRDVQKALRLKVEAGTRVALIDNADSMMGDAQSAFLKTLEEPPPGTVIVLVTSRPAMMLQTIASRCQRINFGPLAEGFISGFLVERKGMGREEACLAARLSAGSLSAAMRFAEEANIQRAGRYTEALSGLFAGGTDDLLDLAKEMSDDDSLFDALELLKVRLRDEAVCRVRGKGVAHGAVAPWGNVDAAGLARLFFEVENATRLIGPPRNANKQLAMEVLLMKFLDAGMGSGPGIEDI